MNSDVDRVSNFLKSRSLHASRLWTEGCVEYFKSQHPGSQLSIFDLQNFAFDQWLLADLRSMEVGSLPSNLSSIKDITLSGTYAVQVESVRDVSTPAYSQLLLLRGVSMKNIDATKKQAETWEPKPRRVLRLNLYDGVQEAVGVEFSPIRELDKNLTPGTKMLIIGPVRCKKGFFILHQKNVNVLGGEVDTLITVNALENVLARALKLPENPDPYGIHGNTATGIGASVELGLSENRQQQAPEAASNNHPNDMDFPDDDELDYLELAEIPDGNRNSPKVSIIDKKKIEEVLLDDDDDDLLLQLPVGQLESQEPINQTDIKQRTSSGPLIRELSSSITDEGPSSKRHKVSDNIFSKGSSTSSHYSVSNMKSGLQCQERLGGQVVDAGPSRDDEIYLQWSSASSPKVIKAAPFVYLKQLISLSAPGIYSVKGFLVTLLSKLEEKGGCWSLQAKLSDGSASVNIDFSDEVLEEIVGFSTTELHALRKKMSGNPAIKERLKEGFQQAKTKLYNLNCIFHLQCNPNSETYTVIRLEELSLKHLAMMKSRSWE